MLPCAILSSLLDVLQAAGSSNATTPPSTPPAPPTPQDPPPARVQILTTFDLDEYVLGALRACAAGFVLKDASRETLVEAIHVVHAGDALLSPSITRRLIEDYATRGAFAYEHGIVQPGQRPMR